MPREFDLEAFVRSKTHLGRDELIRELVIEGDRQEGIAGSRLSEARRTPRGDRKQRLQNEDSITRHNAERIGQLLWFLYNGRPPFGVTEEDLALYKELAEKIRRSSGEGEQGR